jgi:hypothetical protein
MACHKSRPLRCSECTQCREPLGQALPRGRLAGAGQAAPGPHAACDGPSQLQAVTDSLWRTPVAGITMASPPPHGRQTEQFLAATAHRPDRLNVMAHRAQHRTRQPSGQGAAPIAPRVHALGSADEPARELRRLCLIIAIEFRVTPGWLPDTRASARWRLPHLVAAALGSFFAVPAVQWLQHLYHRYGAPELRSPQRTKLLFDRP